MNVIKDCINKFISCIKSRNKRAEQIKAGKKWDSIVEELRERKSETQGKFRKYQ